MPKHPEPKHPDPKHPEIHTLDEYLDGDLEPRARAAFEAHLEFCADCREELALARRVSDGLHSLPLPACPPAVTRAVLEAARPTLGERLRDAWRDFTAPGHAWQPALALLLAAALGLGLWRLADAPPAVSPPVAASPPTLVEAPINEYSPAEVARAKAEVELAFAYLGKISRTASDTVEEKVLENRMVVPLTRTLGVLSPPRQDEKGAGHASS